MKIQTQSTVKPKKYSIERIEDSKCTVLFFDNVEEKQDEENNIIYVYDMYDIEVLYRENLKESIENNYEKWLEEAKNKSYNEAAEKVRKKRNELLLESDKEMCIDRLGIEIPENINMTNAITILVDLLKTLFKILKGDVSTYRKELRDITKQDGFPYNVKFPIKPIKEESEE